MKHKNNNSPFKVTSHDQKGGITAGTINLGELSTKEERGIWKNPWFKRLLIPVFVIILAGIFLYYYTGNEGGETIMGDKYDVNSYNQQGGVTAGQINVGKQDRVLTPQLQQQIKSLLQEDKTQRIEIKPTHLDAETIRFADKIKDYLVSLGYKNTERFNGMIVFAKDDWEGDVNIIPNPDGSIKEIVVDIQK